MRIHSVLGVVAAAVLCACSSSSSSTPDAGKPGDAGADSSVPTPDAGEPDADASVASDSAPPDDAGASDAADTSVPPLACPAWDGSVESPACTDCLRSLCCAPTSACENDPTCVALDSCVNDCLTADAGAGDDDGGETISDCANACFSAQTQATRDEYHAYSDCIGTTCGGNSGAGPCL